MLVRTYSDRSVVRAIWATLSLLAIVTASVLAGAYPATEATRLRNALLIQSPESAAWRWIPPNYPPGFLREQAQAPAPIADAALRIRAMHGSSDLGLARALTSHLIVPLREEGGRISSMDIEATYRGIVERGAGYCADVVDAFVALALAADLHVRTWAFSFDGFGGHGHVVVEVYDRQRGQWIMIDVFSNLLVRDASSGQPLDVERFLSLFRANEATVRFEAIGPGRPGFARAEKLYEYYRRGIGEWYFWNGNNVVSRDKGHIVRAAAALAEPLGELAAIAAGRFPTIVPRMDESNRNKIDRMVALKSRLLWSFGLACALIVLLFGLLCLRWRQRNYVSSLVGGGARG